MSQEKPTRYLSSMIHYLSIAEAAAYKNEGWVVYMEDDGTWTAVQLQDEPKQPGQHPWIGNNKPTLGGK